MVQDAVVAVLLVEASMQSAFLRADVGLHKDAPLDSDADYLTQGFFILTNRKDDIGTSGLASFVGFQGCK